MSRDADRRRSRRAQRPGRVRFHTLFACAGVLTVDIAATRD